jgi:hypothetical protein
MTILELLALPDAELDARAAEAMGWTRDIDVPPGWNNRWRDGEDNPVILPVDWHPATDLNHAAEIEDRACETNLPAYMVYLNHAVNHSSHGLNPSMVRATARQRTVAALAVLTHEDGASNRHTDFHRSRA